MAAYIYTIGIRLANLFDNLLRKLIVADILGKRKRKLARYFF